VLAGSLDAAGSPRMPRVEHWFALVGETALAHGVSTEPERSRLLFDLAVRVDDDEAIGRWFVQACFDPDPIVRHMTIAAIATLGVYVPQRRAAARGLLLQVQRRIGPSAVLDAGLSALTTTKYGADGFPMALASATAEVRAAALATWGAARLSGRPLREPEWRRLAGHVHAGRRGERLARRLRRARSTRDVRSLLQRISERRGRRTAPPARQASSTEPYDERDDYDHDYDRDYDYDYDAIADDDGWPAPLYSPAQQAALAILHVLGSGRTWPGYLGERLSLAQRVTLAHQHPTPDDSPDARVLWMLEDPAPLRTLADLELLALGRRRDGGLTKALDVEPLLADLQAHMTEPAPADPRLRGEALRLATREPALLRALVGSMGDLHPQQRCLAQLAVLRPERPDLPLELDDAVVAQLLQSALTPLLMSDEPPGELDPYPAMYRSVNACAQRVLRSGAGSLRRQDYPVFTLACRPSLSMVRPEHLGELHAIGDALASLRVGSSADDAGTLLEALDGVAAHTTTVEQGDREALVAHACAYATLRSEVMRGEASPIREAHIRRFATRRGELATAPPTTLAELRLRFGEERLIEGLAHAMLAFARQPPSGGPAERSTLRRVWTHRLRLLALLYRLPPLPRGVTDEPEERARVLVEHLVRAFEHAPLELAQALHIPHQQGLPKLAGVAAPLERRLRHLLRRALQLADDDDGVITYFTVRPLDKRAALRRGELGSDCSSRFVPLRALSPHHTYYGLFEGEQQRPGYITVFEAFAEPETGGPRVPVLVLETINVPDGALDGVHQDILHILGAIAKGRGLEGLAVVTEIGTWNYANERLVTACRRYRQGTPVRLVPADPAQWRALERLSQEAGHYCAFRSKRSFRLFAAFDPARDLVHPENVGEAARILAAPPRVPVITARDRDGAPAAFITAIPNLTLDIDVL
jgi:hypothetical protein